MCRNGFTPRPSASLVGRELARAPTAPRAITGRNAQPERPSPLLAPATHASRVFRNNRDLDVALRQALFRAAATGVDVLQVIPGKGTGALRQRVLTTLAQTHLKKLYARVEVDPDNPGRILVHLR